MWHVDASGHHGSLYGSEVYIPLLQVGDQFLPGLAQSMFSLMCGNSVEFKVHLHQVTQAHPGSKIAVLDC